MHFGFNLFCLNATNKTNHFLKLIAVNRNLWEKDDKRFTVTAFSIENFSNVYDATESSRSK